MAFISRIDELEVTFQPNTLVFQDIPDEFVLSQQQL